MIVVGLNVNGVGLGMFIPPATLGLVVIVPPATLGLVDVVPPPAKSGHKT
jgi:hypothetical protein